MSLWKAAILGLYLIATGDFTGALDPEKRITQYIHDAWDKEDGLPQMSARHLVQTDDVISMIGLKINRATAL